MSFRARIGEIAARVLAGEPVAREDALVIASARGADVFDLFGHANRIRERFRGGHADLCGIVSVKTGICPEDCLFCAQSSISKAAIAPHPLLSAEAVLERAAALRDGGARRFGIVASGRRISDDELDAIVRMVHGVRELGISPCASLGMLGEGGLRRLRDAGLDRYHCNLETSRAFFPRICTTHTHDDKLRTAASVRAAGLSLCSGGIFGMGETWEDRIELAFDLRELKADSVPINFLVPIKGTRLEGLPPMRPLEALKAVSLFRFVLPDRGIRIAGGRQQTLGEFNSFIFMAGASGMITGDMLTTQGRPPALDLKLIEEYGLSV